MRLYGKEIVREVVAMSTCPVLQQTSMFAVG